MRRRALCLVLTLALAAGGAVAAEPTDPMESAACRRALETLKAKENALINARRADEARRVPAPAPAASVALDGLRRQAARACLGGNGAPPPPKQIALPPIVVSPIVVPRPAPLPPNHTAAPATPSPARRTGPPVIIATCDPGGCWASDGTRLICAGAHLIGSHGGLCSGTPGMALNCP